MRGLLSEWAHRPSVHIANGVVKVRQMSRARQVSRWVCERQLGSVHLYRCACTAQRLFVKQLLYIHRRNRLDHEQQGIDYSCPLLSSVSPFARTTPPPPLAVIHEAPGKNNNSGDMRGSTIRTNNNYIACRTDCAHSYIERGQTLLMSSSSA